MFPNLSSTEPPGVFVLEEADSSSGMYVFAAIALGFIGFFGFVLNLLVILTVVKIEDVGVRWTPNNVILVNMAVGDLLVATLGSPIAMTSAIARAWYWSYDMCIWYAWFMSTSGFASIGNLTVMALERFLLVTCLMRRTLPLRYVYAMVLSVWIYALCLSLPPILFNWGTYGFEAGNISCSVSWQLHDPETHNDTYIGFLFIFGFFVPVFVIFGCYYSIIKTLRNIRRRLGQNNKRETKITKMVSIMIVAFLVAWLPYAVFAIAVQYFYVEISRTVTILPTLFAKSSICYNPLIYASHFSHAWKKIFSRHARLTNKDAVAITTINRTEMRTLRDNNRQFE